MARLHQLSARNLETNGPHCISQFFCFYAVHVYAFLLLSFCVLPVPSVTDGTVCPVCQTQTGQADCLFSLSRHVLGRPLSVYYCYYKLNVLITVSSKKKHHKNCIVILHIHTRNVITKLWLMLGSARTELVCRQTVTAKGLYLLQ